ncbi:MAG TPA: hypothetical protein VE955_08785 [Candidatus Dormibacteraeota bacterium]|nr:hypothetical protein [Candidatus Dormibacteraeota bacterium]
MIVRNPPLPSEVFPLVTIQMLMGVLLLVSGGTVIVSSARHSLPVLTLLGFTSFLVGIAYLIACLGTYSGRAWAWKFSILVPLVSSVTSLMRVDSGFPSPIFSLTLGLDFESAAFMTASLVTIIFLLMPNVRAYLSNKSSESPLEQRNSV